jgi:hypothetical protein
MPQTSTTTADSQVTLIRPQPKRHTVPYPHAHYWFFFVLTVLVVGFWDTYFAQLGQGTVDLPHHVHGIAMLLWMVMLISQSWLIHARRFSVHRYVGRSSLLLAPVVVIAGCWVNIYMLRPPVPSPIPSGWLAAFGFGFFQMLAFAALYVMAYLNRHKVQLHARYMVATALVFLPPGLARAWFNYIEPVIGWGPGALLTSAVPLLIGLWLLSVDWRRGNELRPYLFFASLWTFGLGLRMGLPNLSAWQDITLWFARIQS